MFDVVADIAQPQQTFTEYDQWMSAWHTARQSEWETVMLTGRDESLSTLLVHRTNGSVMALHYRPSAETDAECPAPSTVGMGETLSSQHRLAARWPKLGWERFVAPQVHGKGLFVYPLGPVRADVAESLLYRLTVMGDEIVHVHLDNGFKRRHIRDLVHHRTIAEAMPIISMFTTTSNVHHTLAMSLACEEAWGLEVHEDVSRTRTLMAELERAYSHIGDLAVLVVSTGLPVPQMEYLHLKEELLRVNHTLFGHRYIRGSVVPGGLDTSQWPTMADMATIKRTIHQVLRQSNQIAEDLELTTSFLDRLHGAGIIPTHQIAHIRPVGPVGRSSGLATDVRYMRPYAGYNQLALSPVSVLTAADSYARYRIRVTELEQSLEIIDDILDTWSPESVRQMSTTSLHTTHEPPKTASGIGIVEAPRGMLGYWVQLDPDSGRIEHLGIATPSQRNWMTYPNAMANGNILQDFPIIDASFSLSVAGWDG